MDPPDPTADPSRRIEGEELGALIAEATRKIPEKYRVPFLLREVNQLSYEVCCQRLKSQGFEFRGSLEQGITETIALLRQSQA